MIAKKRKQASIDNFNIWYNAGNSEVHFMFDTLWSDLSGSPQFALKIIKDWKYPLISKGLKCIDNPTWLA